MRHAAVGVLAGVFDLFNVGHLDALIAAAGGCDSLVVAVAADDLAAAAGHRRPFVPETERLQIVGAVRGVERAVLLTGTDLTPLLAGSGAGVLFAVPGESLTDSLETPDGVDVVVPREVRVTASAAVRDALAGAERRSSVA